jgi:hypothetical protein
VEVAASHPSARSGKIEVLRVFEDDAG